MSEGRCERSACVFDWEGDKLPPYLLFLESLDEGVYFSVFFPSLMPQPKSLQKLISMMMIVQCFLLKEIGSREGEVGPLSIN